MFGRQNDQPVQHNGDEDTPDGGGPIEDALKTMAVKQPEKIITPTGAAPAVVKPSDTSNPAWQHPGTPLDNKGGGVDGLLKPGSQPAPASPPLPPATPKSLIAAPSPPAAMPPVTPAPTSTPVPVPSPSDDTLHDLMTIKQKALSDLSPLIGQLDQPPEDRFRTLMMMIQASDDQSMIKVAYAVAETIEDEKIRAQALLDIVNEINYFTSQQHNQA